MAAKTTETNNPMCYCGCAQPTNPNRNYRPGHDARHVSAKLALAVAQLTGGGYVEPHEEWVRVGAQFSGSLPTPALAAKLLGALDRAERTALAKRDRAQAREAAKAERATRQQQRAAKAGSTEPGQPPTAALAGAGVPEPVKPKTTRPRTRKTTAK